MTEFLTNFHFIRPWWLLGCLPALAAFMFMLHQHQRSSQWQKVIDERLLPFLLEGSLTGKKRFPLYGLLALWMLACLALAGPAWQKIAQPVQKELSALMILWDLSPSMEAKDLKPSRLTRARLKLVDLLDEREEGLTGLIVYSGDAHMVTPLTDDVRTIESQLSGLSPSMMPSKGSRVEEALAMAIQSFKDASVGKGEIVILTDGIAPDAIPYLKDIAGGSAHRITVWGIGTQQGAPIPQGNGFARSRTGEIVIAKLDEDSLSQAAMAMDGVYVPFSNDELDISTILNFGFASAPSTSQEKNRMFDQWYEQGHWLALLLLPFAALAFRRGWVLGLLFFFSVGHSPDTFAFGWHDLWQTKDQQAQETMQESPEEAARLFKDPNWRAAAHYKSGAYERAESFYSNGTTASDLYNYGNTLTQQGQYDEAIAAYNQALTKDSDFNQAQENKKIAEQLKQLQEQQQQQQNQQQDGQEQNQQDGQQSQDQQQQQDGQQNQQEQSQQEQQQGQQKQSEQQQGEQGQQQDQQSAEQDAEDAQQAQEQMAENQSEANEEQQKAMQEQYSQEQKTQEQKTQEEQERLSEEEKEQQAARMQQMEEQENAEQSEDEQAQQQFVELTPEMQEQKEAKQALEQWLRKVPDDPSGLLRNKFQYEYNQRRREMTNTQSRSPDGQQSERW